MKALDFPRGSFSLAATVGAIVWVALLIFQQPDLHHDQWARLLLQLAALVWMPLALSLMNPPNRRLQYVVFPAAITLVVSLQLPAGWIAFAWAIPWTGITAILFVAGVQALAQDPYRAGHWAVAAAQVFLLIGGLATMADRLGLQPLGFDPAIILLTAVHFHYAGFILLLPMGWAALRWPAPFFTPAVWLMLIAVPLTAAGITVAQVTGHFQLETLAACLVALSGWGVAFGYIRVILKEDLPRVTRWCWGIMAVSLLFSMTLSVGYAVRIYWPVDLLNLPAMRAFHGTANAFGVAGGGLLGWYFFNRANPKANL